jgi:hypothetical protein
MLDLDLKQRNIIRDYLDSGMTPDSVANYLGRVADLEPGEVDALRAAAEDILNDVPDPGHFGRPRLTLIKGGAAADEQIYPGGIQRQAVKNGATRA